MNLIDVIPANAGIQHLIEIIALDSGAPLRYARNDGLENIFKTNRTKGDHP